MKLTSRNFQENLSEIEKLYTNNLQELGSGPKALGWKTKEEQNLRFFKLTSNLLNKSQNLTINDYGCGFGELLNWLLANEFKVSSYDGYDISSNIISKTKKNLQNLDLDSHLHNSSLISSTSDYTIVSGTFNVKMQNTESEWTEFIIKTLKEINTHSIKGFSFNLLSSYVDWKEPTLYYGDPLFWFDFCKTNFSKKVNLIHDYPLYEWTIMVKKD